jgi:hypothetical protein
LRHAGSITASIGGRECEWLRAGTPEGFSRMLPRGPRPRLGRGAMRQRDHARRGNGPGAGDTAPRPLEGRASGSWHWSINRQRGSRSGQHNQIATAVRQIFGAAPARSNTAVSSTSSGRAAVFPLWSGQRSVLLPSRPAGDLSHFGKSPTPKIISVGRASDVFRMSSLGS